MLDFKDRDIKSVVEDKILNPEKLKQGGATRRTIRHEPISQNRATVV